MRYDYVIVGAGFSGAVIAERIASQSGKSVLVIDKRDHIGGNCYDFLNSKGILVQKYGPHIFHTKNKKVWDYISQFTSFNDYKHKVISFYRGNYYPIPINRETVNKFYNLQMNSEEELKAFLEKIRTKISEIKHSKDVVVSKFGEELYEAFVKHYTKKQWDKYPEELNKEVLERLPIKYDDDPFYFSDPFQGMPLHGYSKMFEKMLSNKNIKLLLNKDFFEIKNLLKCKNLIYTGPLDQFFDYKFGKLEYRGINFLFEDFETDSFNLGSVINYPEKEFPFGRVTEFKKFYGLNMPGTTICKEFFTWEGEPSFPVISESNLELAKRYLEESAKINNAHFIGRLGRFKYIDMDKAIEDSLNLFEEIEKQG